MKRNYHSLILIAFMMALMPVGQSQAVEATKGLLVYPSITGIPSSTRFSVRVAEVTTGARVWSNLFTMESVGPKKEGVDVDYIYQWVTGHSSSWATFEYDVPVEVEITKLSPGDINTCVIRPRARDIACTVSPDKKKITFVIPVRKVAKDKITTVIDQAPINITAEINGQTKETISIFASPHLQGKPSPTGPGVYAVNPGDTPPTSGPWTTLYFKPGIHRFGKLAYKMEGNKSYYIPGDAWVETPFADGGDRARIFGLGVLSHRETSRKEMDDGLASKILNIRGKNSVIEGLTLVESKNHSLFGNNSDLANPVIIRNVKLQNWGRNSDGIHFFSHGIAEDCFFRTQDDMHYMGADSIFRRMVYWKDETFGTEILFAGSGSNTEPDASMDEDSDSIYYHCEWVGNNIGNRAIGSDDFKQNGGSVIGYRIEKPGKKGAFPFIDLGINAKAKIGFIKNMLFKDIRVYNDTGKPRIRVSSDQPLCIIEDITFEDIKIGDRWVEDFSDLNFELPINNCRNLRIIRNGIVVATHNPVSTGKPEKPEKPFLSGNSTATPTVFGVATVRPAIVRIYVAGIEIGSAVADIAGAWTYPLSGLSTGTHSVTVVVENAAGMKSPASDPLTVNKASGGSSTIPGKPAKPTIVGDGTATPTLSGTTDVKPAKVRIYVDLKEVGLVDADSTGAWSYTLSDLPAGPHSITVVVENAAGKSPASDSLTVTIASGGSGTPPASDGGGGGGCGLGSGVVGLLATLFLLFRSRLRDVGS